MDRSNSSSTILSSFPSELQEKFLKLQQAYAAKLPGKLTELEQALAEVGVQADALQQAKTMAHRLRGTAGSYGFSAISRAGGELEDVLRSVQQGGATLSASQPHIRTLLQQIREGIAQPDRQAGFIQST